jgi:pyridoxine/pyridoxamine 5'-phosphate oxidase
MSDDPLDRLLQASIERAGPYLRESFEMPEHSMDAARVRALFERARTIALATVAPTGVPRVAPVDAFLDGTAFCVPTVATSARCRHLTTNPAASLTCFEKDWAVLAHGTSAIVRESDDAFGALEERAREAGMSSVLEWGEGVYVRVEPELVFTWTRAVGGPSAGA